MFQPILLSGTLFFFFNDTATTEIYTLSLHDALPISGDFVLEPAEAELSGWSRHSDERPLMAREPAKHFARDRKSTRLNSSHGYISYAVFCLKKKNEPIHPLRIFYSYRTALVSPPRLD